MKIRQGFVSNSSSTCFIVAFPREIKNKNDIMEILFKDKKHVVGYDDALDAEEVADILFNQLKNPLTKKELIKELDRYNLYINGKQSVFVRRSVEVAQNFIDNNKGKFIYDFNFSDEGDEKEAIMRNGNQFSELENEAILTINL